MQRVTLMNDKIAVIGVGMMGGVIVKSLLKSGYSGKITAIDIKPEKLKEQEKLGVAVSTDNRKAAADADIIFICVKPTSVKEVLTQINNSVKGKLVISIAATVPLFFYKKFIPDAKIIRIMPNVAALVQESYTPYCCGKNVTETDKDKVKSTVEEALKWLEGNQLASKEEYREKKNNVEAVCKEVISKLSAGMPPQGMPEEQTNSGPNIEEVD